jgi:hypothetical protein
MKDTDSLGATIHWWHRRTRDASRVGYLEVRDEGLMVRVEDDFYDGEISKEEALEIAREILRRYGP